MLFRSLGDAEASQAPLRELTLPQDGTVLPLSPNTKPPNTPSPDTLPPMAPSPASAATWLRPDDEHRMEHSQPAQSAPAIVAAPPDRPVNATTAPSTLLQRMTDAESEPADATLASDRKSHVSGVALLGVDPPTLAAATPHHVTSAPVIQPRTKPLDQTNAASDAEPITASTFNPTPLETIWPVQRRSDALADSLPPLQPRLNEGVPLAGALPPVNNPGAAIVIVQRALQQVATGQPTDSPVELVAPRRPRPSLGPSTDSSSMVSHNRSDALGRVMMDEVSADTVQRQPVASTAMAQTEMAQTAMVQPAMVQTGIGPLPADLWRLIGQTPPDPVAQPSMADLRPSRRDLAGTMGDSGASTVETPGNVADKVYPTATTTQAANALPVQLQTLGQQTPVRRLPKSPSLSPSLEAQSALGDITLAQTAPSPPFATLPVSMRAEPDQAPDLATYLQAAPFIQRQLAVPTSEADGAIATAPPTISATEPASDEEGQASAPVDVDELAHQVYAHLKQRLRIEQEWLRRM